MVVAETERECASVLAKKLFGICERSGRGEEKLQAFCRFLCSLVLVFVYFYFYICFAIKTDYCKNLRSLCGTFDESVA